MSTREFERRRPHVTVQDLRRDLRHADQQLFALLEPAPPVPARIRPRRGPIALALAGMVPLAFGAWASLAGERAHGTTASVGVEVTPTVATIVPDPARPTPLGAEHGPQAPERRLQPAPPTIARTVAPRKAAWEPPRRHVPRPLSPGEFGRR